MDWRLRSVVVVMALWFAGAACGDGANGGTGGDGGDCGAACGQDGGSGGGPGGSGGSGGEGGVGGTGGSPQAAAITLSAGANPDLLFFVSQGDQRLFFEGAKEEDALDPGLVKISHEDGSISTVVLTKRFIPIQWMTTGLTLEVRTHPDDEEFDEKRAVVLIGDGTSETAISEDYIVDLSPPDLAETLERFEERLGTKYPEAHAFLEREGSDWAVWQTKAMTPGVDQPRYIVAVTAWGMAATLFAIEDAAAMSLQGFYGMSASAAKSLVGVAATMMGGVIGDALSPHVPKDPDVPTVGALLCQGATKVQGICHYMFFVGGDPFPCVNLCLTNMGCFSGICQPTEISWEEASSLRGGF